MTDRHLLAALALTLTLDAGASASTATPPGWPARAYDAHDNATTPAGFELGRRLFYDPNLSRDGTVSCASCHQQAAAFAHARHRVSHGIDGQLGTRNAPALFNLAWQPDFMWDGSVAHLEFQPLSPIANPAEMGQDVAHLADRLAADPGYPPRFAQAFGSEGVDTPRMLRALAQFLSSMVSADARYDRVAAGHATFTPAEARGHAVFREHCAACHAEPLFTDFSFRGNGLDARPADAGREAVSGRPEDRGRFRVPSLRNVRLTAPYMHDGRFGTLDAVLDHYDHGIHPSAALDPLLANGIRLAAGDRAALLAFLDTLTDDTFVHDARFAAPPGDAPVVAQRALLDRLADVLGAAAQAHEGDEHASDEGPAAHGERGGHAHPGAPDPASPHLAMSAPPYELVAVRDGDDLAIYLDDYATNAPLTGLDLTVRVGGAVLRAGERGDGVYEIPADRLAPEGAQPIVFHLRTPAGETELQGTLPAAQAGPAPEHRRPWPGVLGLLAVALVIAIGLVTAARRHARPR